MLNFKSSGVKIKMSISAETTPLLGGIIVLLLHPDSTRELEKLQ